MASKEVADFSNETALEDMSFNEMLASEQGVIDVSDIDTTLLVDQEDLVGKPFILFDWEMKVSTDYKRSDGAAAEYAICHVKTEDGKTRIFTDGGTGIPAQLERYRQKMIDKGITKPPFMYFHFGLRYSDYTNDYGKGRTYYFDNRPRP